MREQRARRAEAEVRRELTPLRVAVGSALEENREHGAGRLVEQRHRARLLKAQARRIQGRYMGDAGEIQGRSF